MKTGQLQKLATDNNCYYNPNIPVQLNIGAANGGNYGVLGDKYSLADWQQELGFGAGSVEANPLFEDIDAENFQLADTSPCTVPEGATLVTLTATRESQTSTIDVNIEAVFANP